MKSSMKKNFFKILSTNWVILLGLFILVFVIYGKLFNSYFESDEWFYFTYYFPLTREPYGVLNSIVSTITNSNYISGSQHVVPVASLIYFLNTKFFGLNFVPYAFMSLFFHTINSFLVYLFVKSLLYEKGSFMKNTYSILSSLFFAISPIPMHAITGFAAFYGQNVLSITFFILCLLFYKSAFVKKEKKLIYVSVVFLFLALFTKESTSFIFLLLPLMTLIEKRIFPFKFLSKIYLICLAVYLVFRFLIPGISVLPGKLIDNYISHSSMYQTKESVAESMGSSINPGIHRSQLGEIIFRTFTFPIKMTGSIFLPQQTVFSIVQFIAPIISPIPPGGDTSIYSEFIYLSGQATIIYLGSIAIIVFCLISVLNFMRRRRYEETRAIVIGMAIITFGALPLVAIMFTFPNWGYGIYFDSRHYYNPAVGAAIIFPFLIFGIAKFISKILHIKRVLLITFALFLFWLTNNAYAFDKSIKLFTQNYTKDRKESINQLMGYLPKLKDKTVFYFETDGQAPFSSLPFFTSVPQAITVAYYKSSPLPNTFFGKPLFSGNIQGYQFSKGKGFGYYISKKNLSDDLILEKFNPKDIYAFYYYGGSGKLKNITLNVRKEMEDYIRESTENSEWVKFTDSKKIFFLLHPVSVQIKEGEDFIQITSPTFNYKLFLSPVSTTFNLTDYLQVLNQRVNGEIVSQKVNFDRFHSNQATIIKDQFHDEYYIKLDNNLFSFEDDRKSISSTDTIQKIIGSLELIKKI